MAGIHACVCRCIIRTSCYIIVLAFPNELVIICESQIAIKDVGGLGPAVASTVLSSPDCGLSRIKLKQTLMQY